MVTNAKIWSGSAWITTEDVDATISSNGTAVTSGGYEYHTFTSSGSLTVQRSGKVEVLLIGGGGGGGSGGGGGGGAGQVFNDFVVLEAGTYSVNVGAGSPGTCSTRGSDTFIGTGVNPGQNFAISFGSGSGCAGYQQQVDKGGASGSGGSIYEAGGFPLLNNTFYGNAGGNGQYVEGGGGGGGAGGAGGNSTSSVSGVGGVGTSAYSAWGLATTTGQNVSGTVYYGGGGSGSAYNGQVSISAGGLGGGGANSAGLVNTGGGGSNGNGGGSGLAIIRVPV